VSGLLRSQCWRPADLRPHFGGTGVAPADFRYRHSFITLLQNERLLCVQNCDAFIVFRSFPSQENAPEHSNQERSSLKGSDQQGAVSVSRGTGGEWPKAVPLTTIDANRAARQRPLSYHATCLADTIIISI